MSSSAYALHITQTLSCADLTSSLGMHVTRRYRHYQITPINSIISYQTGRNENVQKHEFSIFDRMCYKHDDEGLRHLTCFTIDISWRGLGKTDVFQTPVAWGFAWWNNGDLSGCLHFLLKVRDFARKISRDCNHRRWISSSQNFFNERLSAFPGSLSTRSLAKNYHLDTTPDLTQVLQLQRSSRLTLHIYFNMRESSTIAAISTAPP